MRNTSPLRNLIVKELIIYYIKNYITKNNYFEDYSTIKFDYYSIILKQKINIEFSMLMHSNNVNDYLMSDLKGEYDQENHRFNSPTKAQIKKEYQDITNNSRKNYKLNKAIKNVLVEIKLDSDVVYRESMTNIGIPYFYKKIELSNLALLKEINIAIAHYFKLNDSPILKSEILSLHQEISKINMNPFLIRALNYKQEKEAKSKESYTQPYWKRQQESYQQQLRQRDTGIFAGWF